MTPSTNAARSREPGVIVFHQSTRITRYNREQTTAVVGHPAAPCTRANPHFSNMT